MELSKMSFPLRLALVTSDDPEGEIEEGIDIVIVDRNGDQHTDLDIIYTALNSYLANRQDFYIAPECKCGCINRALK